MRRGLRRVLIAGLGLLASGAAGIAALQVAIARGAFTSQVDAALERATGRAVTHGAVTVRPGLRPRIVLTEAGIANLPGGSRPDFARIGRLEVTLALLPLIAGRVEIDSLRLSDAEILLERDAEGRPNWAFGSGGGGGVAVAAVEIAGARLLIPQGRVTEIEVERLRLARDEPEDPLALAGRIRLDGEALTISARLGIETDGALPVEARIEGDGLHLRLAGTWPRRTEEAGWSLAIEAEAGAAAAQRIAGMLGREIPAPGPLGLAARLAPGSPWPVVSDFVLRLGPMEAGALLPGLHVARAELRAASFDGPATLSAQGRRGGADLGLTATLPSPRRLLDAAEGPLPVEAVLTSGRSRLALAGEIRGDRAIGATEFAARLTTPDFAAIGPLLGAALPRLTGVTAEARLSGLLTNGLDLRGLRWTSDGVQAEGDLAMTFAPRLAFRGQVTARRIDLDALGGGGTATRDRRRAIPDLPLPIATLRGMDAALDLSAATLVAGGATWREARTRLTLTDGRLAAENLSVATPGGTIAGRLTIDAAAQVPQVGIALRSQGRGLDLAALRRAFGVPAGFDGLAELALDLRGRGASTRALAATLSGEAGVAMVGGRFTGATALRIGPSLARVLTPRGTPSGGLALRCLAIRLSAEDGVAQSQALLMEGEFGRIDGSLALNLRDETLAARLLPDIRVMGVTVRAPVHIGGTLMDPRVGVEPGAALARVIGDTVANRLWRSSTVEFLRGASGSTPPGGDCGAALTLARLGRAGPVPAAAAAPVPLVPRELQGTAQEVVRGIGGLLGGRRR